MAIVIIMIARFILYLQVIAFARSNTAYNKVSNHDMFAPSLKAVVPCPL